MTPIFLISLPRSGSTLLQRILSTSNNIATTSEPWINLGVAQLFEQYSENIAALSNYSFSNLRLAVNDFACEQGRITEATRSAINIFISSLYDARAQRPDIRFFLDKTPRYYFIIDFLAEIFPNAKFIFLTRNLDAVAASIFNTWYNGRYMLYHHYSDLAVGPELIKTAWDKYAHRSLLIKYEDLLLEPDLTLQSIETYLELDKNELRIEQALGISIHGTMGDPTGQYQLKSLRPEPDLIEFYSHVQRLRIQKLLNGKTRETMEYFGRKPSCVRYKDNALISEVQDIKGILLSESALYIQKALLSTVFKLKSFTSRMKLS